MFKQEATHPERGWFSSELPEAIKANTKGVVYRELQHQDERFKHRLFWIRGLYYYMKIF